MVFTELIDFEVDQSVLFPVGFVGEGPALEGLALLLADQDWAAIFPTVQLAGWVPGGNGASTAIPAFLCGCPRYDGIRALAAARPDLRAVFDLTPDLRHMPALRAEAPPQASIGSGEAILRFCAAAHSGRISFHSPADTARTQTLFGLLVNQIDGDILILSKDGVILDVNRHASASRGLSRKDMVGRYCTEFDKDGSFRFHSESCPFARAKAKGKAAECTFDQILENGQVRYLYSVCLPVTDAFGGPPRYMYIRRDVTRQHRLEKLVASQEKDAALGKLTLYLAHEIRNPLFTVGGFANALYRNASLDAAAREKARIIVEESRRLDEILAKILNFAKKTEQSIGEFAPDELVRQSLESMAPENGRLNTSSGSVTLTIQLEPNLPRVRGNIANVRDGLNNMIKNALEAMPEGGALTLAVRRSGAYVLIEIRDTGRGIPAELQEQVFNPFFSTKEGMGLGLGMTRKLIEEMGGKVQLVSTPGVGTCVKLFIPVALAVREDDAAASPGEAPDPAEALDRFHFGNALTGDSGDDVHTHEE